MVEEQLLVSWFFMSVWFSFHILFDFFLKLRRERQNEHFTPCLCKRFILLEKSPSLSKCNYLCKKRSTGAVLLCDYNSLWLHKLLAAALFWAVHEALEKRIDFQNSLERNENEFINKGISTRALSHRPVDLFCHLNVSMGTLSGCFLSHLYLSQNDSYFMSAYMKKMMPCFCPGYRCRRVTKRSSGDLQNTLKIIFLL